MLGTDPEIFVTARGNLLPAYEFLPSKAEAKAARTCDGGMVKLFWDGFQAEYTTYGHICLAWLIDEIRDGLAAIRTEAKLKDPYAELSLDNVVEIPKALRRAADIQHVMLGCDPSINVYGLRGEEVFDARELPWRMSGGHVHLGDKTVDPENLVKCEDAILGVWAVGAARNIDNPLRRRYYGLAGEFRLPEHGVEYRTLSNFWLCHPAIANLTFEIARAVLRRAIRKDWLATDREVVEVINNCDVAGAEAILKRNANKFVEILQSALGMACANAALEIGLNGVEAAIRDPRNLVYNWYLDGGWSNHSNGVNCTWEQVSKKMVQGEKV